MQSFPLGTPPFPAPVTAELHASPRPPLSPGQSWAHACQMPARACHGAREPSRCPELGAAARSAPDIREIQPGPSQWSSDLHSAWIDASYYYGYSSNAIDVNSTSQTQTKPAT